MSGRLGVACAVGVCVLSGAWVHGDSPAAGTSTTRGAGVAGGIARVEAGPSPVITLKGSLRSILYLAFTPDGKILAAGGDDKSVDRAGLRDGLVRLWDLPGGQPRAPIRDPAPPGAGTNSVSCVAFSPDGTTQVTGSGSRTATGRSAGPTSR